MPIESMAEQQQVLLTISSLILLLVMLSSSLLTAAAAGADSDKEECAEQLAGLATCLQYVGGNAKAPTPDCCSGLKQLLNTNKKCLCVIIRDRNDPDLGLKINLTLALSLPSVCHAPANVSKCPELLKLPPNSPEAQVFYQFGNHTNSSAAAAPAPSTGATIVGGGSGSGSSAQQNSSSGRKRWPFGIKTSCCWQLLLGLGVSLLFCFFI